MKEVNTGCLGINLQIFKNNFFPDTDYADLEAEALQRGLPACTAVFAMSTHIPDDLTMNGAFFFDNPLRANVLPIDLYHAFLLNNAFYMVVGLKELDKTNTAIRDYVIGCAGGFSSKIVAQAIADIYGREVRVYRHYDFATSVGCLILCNRALGLPEFVPELLYTAVPMASEELIEYHENWLSRRESVRAL
jgi:autoinducer 2 (AI-2) kinase